MTGEIIHNRYHKKALSKKDTNNVIRKMAVNVNLYYIIHNKNTHCNTALHSKTM
jgi:hypothetical protein